MKMTYYIGKYFGKEEFSKEFKELYLQDISSFFDEMEIYDLIRNNVPLSMYKFNEMMDSTIKSYMFKYIPKYIGNFSKAKTSGDLYIGIDDMGFVEGIPYYGNLDKKKIKNYILATMINTRGIYCNDDGTLSDDNNRSVVSWYYKNLDIQIIKLDTYEEYTGNNFNTDVADNLVKLNQLVSQNQKIVDIWNVYIRAYKKWHSERLKYGGKLINYLIEDDMRQGLIKYVINEFSTNPTYDKSKLDTILEFFNKDKEYYEQLTFTLDYIETILNDQYSPIRWLVKYKDGLVNEINKKKPQRPSEKADDELYLRFCNSVSNIKTHLIKTSNINFYLIKISIPNMHNTYLEYRYNETSSWISRARTLLSSGPSCC